MWTLIVAGASGCYRGGGSRTIGPSLYQWMSSFCKKYIFISNWVLACKRDDVSPVSQVVVQAHLEGVVQHDVKLLVMEVVKKATAKENAALREKVVALEKQVAQVIKVVQAKVAKVVEFKAEVKDVEDLVKKRLEEVAGKNDDSASSGEKLIEETRREVMVRVEKNAALKKQAIVQHDVKLLVKPVFEKAEKKAPEERPKAEPKKKAVDKAVAGRKRVIVGWKHRIGQYVSYIEAKAKVVPECNEPAGGV